MQDVEPASAAVEAERVPGGVSDDAREPAGTAEGEELELEPGATAERAHQPAHVAGGAGARLDERRGVDPDPHRATASS